MSGKQIHHDSSYVMSRDEVNAWATANLGPSQVKVFNQCLTTYKKTGQGLQATPVMELLQCSKQVASRHLARLWEIGLLIREGHQFSGYTYYPEDMPLNA